MANSKIPLRKWAIGTYLCLTSLKLASSMKLNRDSKIGQKAGLADGASGQFGVLLEGDIG